MLPDLKLYYKTTVIKIVWYWNENKHTDQWKRIKKFKLTHSTDTVFLRTEKQPQNGERKIFSTDATKNGQPRIITPYSKVNSKLIKNLHET